MLSRILRQSHKKNSGDPGLLYLFEEGDLSEHDIAREIIPLLKKYDANGKGKPCMLSDTNKLVSQVPGVLLKPVPEGEGSNIAGIRIPKAPHEAFGLDCEFTRRMQRRSRWPSCRRAISHASR
jgi:hypothetical protein